MKFILRILFFILLLHEGYGVIYHLNASEFNRMPPIYKLDDYNSCLQKPTDVYCTMIFKLVSDEPNELFHMIEEYSENSKTHYNHTKLRYGLCVTQNCQDYIQYNTSVAETVLERCLNQSFWKNYQLKTRMLYYFCSNSSDNEVDIDNSDIVAGIILFTIIVLCVIGSLYDICTSKNHEAKHFLLSFSITRNWKRLTSTKPSNEPRLQNLKGLNGLKCMGELMVIGVHSSFLYFILGKNIHDIELSYHHWGLHILINGAIMIQTYFVISAFLLIYNLELYAEKHSVNWSLVFRGILMRYIRLTPSYAVVILLTATWFKFAGPGPLWELTGKVALKQCKSRWWMNLLYVNNYVVNFQCVPTSWYLATDMQLFCCSLILYKLLRNSKFKKTILMFLTAVGSVIVAVHTYVRDLDHNMFCGPTSSSEMLAEEPTFNETYKMGHGNICSYVIGMALGYLVYGWQKKEKDFKKYWLLKYVYWTVMPILFGVVLSGAFFYRDGPREPLFLRVIYAALVKPIVGILIAIFITGIIFKFDNVHHKVLELDLWIVPARLTYSAYLIHYTLLIIYLNRQTELIPMTAFNAIALSIIVIIVSFVISIPLFLFVESPCKEIIKYFTKPTSEEAMVANGNKVVAVDNLHKESWSSMVMTKKL